MKTAKMCAILILILFAALSVRAQFGDNAAIKVSLVNQEPDPVEPGSYVTLRFKVENTGSQNAKDVVFEILSQYPFSLDESSQKEIGSIDPRQSGDAGAIVKYRIRVDKDATAGINEINARYKVKDGSWVKVGPFNVSIQPSTAVLSIRDVQVNPEIIAPGKKGNVTISVQNTARLLMRDIVIKLEFSSPFSPVGYNERTIASLNPGEGKEINFEIIAQPEAAANSYKIPVLITYSDELNKQYSRNGTLGVIVGARPELDAYIDSSTIYTENSNGEITIKFVNKGLTGIKFLNIKLMENQNYVILSPSTAYIGKISSDDYETADFKIYAAGNQLKLPLLMEYSDANNNRYSEQRALELNLYSESDAKKFGITKQNGNGFLITVAIVVIGIIAFQAWRKIRKK